MPAGGLVTAAVIGLGETAIGLINASKAKKKAAELAKNRPTLKDSPYLNDQLALSESELSTGMSAGAKTAYEEDLDRSESTSLGTALRMGGTPNTVSAIMAESNNGRQKLAIMKDQLRLAEIDRLARAQDAKEEERQQQFQFNEWAPWADQAQANAEARKAAQSEEFQGLNTVAGGAMRFAEGQTAKSQTSFPNSSGPSYSTVAANPNSLPVVSQGGSAGSVAAGYQTINANATPYLNSLLNIPNE